MLPTEDCSVFLPGTVQLVLRSGAPAVPAYIAFETLPRGRRIPKFRRISVAFGRPETVGALRAAGTWWIDEERIANALRQRVISLGVASGAIAGEAVPDLASGPSGVIRRWGSFDAAPKHWRDRVSFSVMPPTCPTSQAW